MQGSVAMEQQSPSAGGSSTRRMLREEELPLPRGSSGSLSGHRDADISIPNRLGEANFYSQSRQYGLQMPRLGSLGILDSPSPVSSSLRSVRSASLGSSSAGEGSPSGRPELPNFGDIPALPSPTSIEVPRMEDGSPDWQNPASQQTLTEILSNIQTLERAVANGAGPNLGELLRSVDKVPPGVKFLERHKGPPELAEMLPTGKTVLQKALQILHRQFVDLLESSSKVVEEPAALRADIEDQVQARRRGLLAGPLQLPEIPSIESVKVLNALAQRLVPNGLRLESSSYRDRRAQALQRNLERLEVESVSSDAAAAMDHVQLISEMDRWTENIRILVQILLVAERKLFNAVLMDVEHSGQRAWPDNCFAELAGGRLAWLLAIGRNLAGAKHGPDTLTALLDMFRVVQDLTPRVNFLFSGKSATVSQVRGSMEKMQAQLSGAVADSFNEFERLLEDDVTNLGTTAAPRRRGRLKSRLSRGKVDAVATVEDREGPSVTSYTVNYLLLLTERGPAEAKGSKDTSYLSALVSVYGNEPGEGPDGAPAPSPLSQVLLRLMAALHRNLASKWQRCSDLVAGNVVFLNEAVYVLDRITSNEGSDAAKLLGSSWHDGWKQTIMDARNDFVNMLVAKLEQQVFSGEVLDAASALRRLKRFGPELDGVIILAAPRIETLQSPELRQEVRLQLVAHVATSYRQFVATHREHLHSTRAHHALVDPEEVEAKLQSAFLQGNESKLSDP